MTIVAIILIIVALLLLRDHKGDVEYRKRSSSNRPEHRTPTPTRRVSYEPIGPIPTEQPPVTPLEVTPIETFIFYVERMFGIISNYVDDPDYSWATHSVHVLDLIYRIRDFNEHGDPNNPEHVALSQQFSRRLAAVKRELEDRRIL